MDASSNPEDEVVERVYDGGYKAFGWESWGWAAQEISDSGPAKIKFTNFGGWISHAASVKTQPFESLLFRAKLPEKDTDFLAAYVQSNAMKGPDVHVLAEHRRALPDGWVEIRLPMSSLNPNEQAFDRVVIHAIRKAPEDWILIDKIGFTRLSPNAGASKLAVSSYDSASVRKASAAILCSARATKISPLIYGNAFYAPNDAQEQQWKMGATIRRWGGNLTSRYNWELHAWNLDFDWFFENKPAPPYTKFLSDNAAHGMMSALTVPIMGWVAKDTTSVGFPVSAHPSQEKTDPYNPIAGNGKTKDGKPIPAGPPTRTSVAVTPEFIKNWVSAIRAADAKTKTRSVHQYILDNEPVIWSTTHRDVRHEPLGYDELVERTIQYGSAIRAADPDAVIAGPAEWGWLGYIYSGIDAKNFGAHADRKAHGDLPLVEWYLQKLREHEQKTGVRVLDVLDFHFYPTPDNIYGGGEGGTDENANALRIRSTRALWDPEYTEESWVNERLRLLPRMKEWVQRNYPGRGISIGEWNFGGESNFSGALATAEALGRFGQYGVASAYYWTFPPATSPTIRSFLAYRNFDGKGGRFLDWSLPTRVDPGRQVMMSMFASRSEDGKHVVAIALNLSPSVPVNLTLDLSACGPAAGTAAFAITRGVREIAPVTVAKSSDPKTLEHFLPPYSITILDVHLDHPMPGTIEP